MTTFNSNKVIYIRACRICLATNLSDKVDLDQKNNLLQLFEYCVGLKVTNKDAPYLFCYNCASNLQNYAKFKEKCIKSESLWKSLTDHEMQCYAEKVSTVFKHDIKVEKLCTTGEYNIKKDDESPDTKIGSKDINIYNQSYGTQIDSVDQHHDIQIDLEDIKDDNDFLSVTIPLNGEFNSIDVKREETAEARNQQGNSCAFNNSDDTTINEEFVCPKCNRKYGVEYYDNEVILKGGPFYNTLVPPLYEVRIKFLTKHMKSCGKPKINKVKLIPKVNVSTPYYCGICEVVCNDKEALNRHLAEHYMEKKLDCKQCKYRGHDLAAIMRHRYFHCPSDIRTRMACHICDMKTQSSMSLEYHYRSVHLGMPGGLCTICNREFTVFKTWKNHELTHKSCKFICDHCGKKYLFKHQIIEHLRSAHSNVKNFICDECGKGFKRMTSLQLHKSSVHYKSAPVNCSHCDKMFKTPITLMEHMKYIATTDKAFQCGVCDKCFASAYKLKQHMFWHSGEKPHCCDICGSRYKAKGQLKIHIRTHTGERPYQCRQCMRSFKDLKLLKRHQRVHTGDTKPFKCELCAKGFTTKGSLAKHRIVRHKNIDEVKTEDKTTLNKT